MQAPSPLLRVLSSCVVFFTVLSALPVTAQVSYTYTAPPPPGYPAAGAPKQMRTTPTRATRQTAAAVQAPATYPRQTTTAAAARPRQPQSGYPSYPAAYPPPAGYTYPPPPPGYAVPPRTVASKPVTKSRTSVKTGTKASPSKKTAGPPPPPAGKAKVYGPTGDLTTQVTRIKDSDKVQNLRLGELERDVSSIKRGGKGSTAPRYDGGTDIAPYTTYVARPGDTLFRVASTHRVSVGEIQQLNRMTEDEVHVGQTLLIPSPHRISATTTQASYRPATPGSSTLAATPSAPAASTSTYYTVKKGDSLKGIALKHKMTTAALASANRIKDANKIIVGQRLSIPSKTVAASKPVSRPRTESADTTPLPDYSAPSSPPPPPPPPPASGLGQGLTLAPAPPAAPAPLASSKPTASASDTHRGILAYRVDRSDTLESIATQFSTTPENIREMNRLQAGTPLKSGDEIMVPAMGAVSVR